MNKLFLFFTACLISQSVNADWVKVNTINNDLIIVYADTSTIQGTGSHCWQDGTRKICRQNRSKMRVLYDFKNIQKFSGIKYFSRKTQVEYNCMTEQSRTLEINDYSSSMGNGKLVNSNSKVAEWKSIIPINVEKKLLAIVCSQMIF